MALIMPRLFPGKQPLVQTTAIRSSSLCHHKVRNKSVLNSNCATFSLNNKFNNLSRRNSVVLQAVPQDNWQDTEEKMNLPQTLLNLVVPPIGIGILLAILPFLWIYNLWSPSPEDVEGKIVVITGASSGIGENMAYEYGKRRARLVLIARRKNQLEDVADRARAHGAMDVHIVTADLSYQEECKKIVEETINIYGGIDHMVINHGVANGFLIQEAQSLDLFKEVMDTNVLGSIYSACYALPHLKKTRGRLVVTASTAGWLPVPRMSIYSASKAAVLTFFDTLRNEVGPGLRGITIALPGYIQSEMTMGKFLSPEGKEEVNTEVRDILIGPSPVAPTQYAAQEIVNAALRGKRHVVVPDWYKVSLPFRVFAPEVLDGVLRAVFAKELQPGKPVLKVIMDTIPSVEKYVYPPGMQTRTKEQEEATEKEGAGKM